MVNGSIPYVQILLGILVGAIGMYVYAKMYKPKFLYDDDDTEKFSVTKKVTKKQKSDPVQDVEEREEVVERKYEQPPPTFIDLRSTIPIPMPNLTQMYEQEHYGRGTEDETDDEEEESEDENENERQ